MSSSRARELAVVSAVSAAAFAGIAVASATRASARVDRKASPKLAARPKSRGRRIAGALSPVGKWYTVVPAAVAGGAILARDRSRRGAGGTIAASSVIAMLLSRVFDHYLPQPPVPRNHRHKPNKAVFPSGHALMATSVGSTAAYVLSRESIAEPRAAAAAAAAFAIANPGLKLAVEKHWLSDAAGGLAAGLAIAAGCCAVYEAMRDDDENA